MTSQIDLDSLIASRSVGNGHQDSNEKSSSTDCLPNDKTPQQQKQESHAKQYFLFFIFFLNRVVQYCKLINFRKLFNFINFVN